MRRMPIKRYIYGTPIPTGAVVVEDIELGNELTWLKFEEGCFRYTFEKEDTVVYGLGESVRGINKRGWIYESFCSDDDMHTETKRSLYGAHNFLVIGEEKPFGIFVDYPGRVTFDIGYTHLNQLIIKAETMDLELYVIEGDTLLEVVGHFRRLIGRSYIPPKWAFGYQQSRWSYKTCDEVRAVAKGFRDNDLPLDSIYLDIDYMERLKDFTIDKDKFPDFKAFVSEMKAQGIRLIPIIDAGVKVESGYSVYDEGVEKGYFVTNEEGKPFDAAVWPGRVHFPDFLNSEARSWFGAQYKGLIDLGIDGFWNDMNEPAIFYTPEAMEEAMNNVVAAKGENIDLGKFFQIKDSFSQIMNKESYFKAMYHNMDGKRVRHYDVHNLYGYYMTRAAGEAFSQIKPDERMLLFSRASYIGMHRYGGIWTGDNRSWWSHLALNIKMMPSLNMCGFLYSGADIGGFSDNTTEDLLIRWLQFGIFTPLLRNHTAAYTRQQEPYEFDGIERFRNLIKLRYALIPYLYSEYMKATLTDGMLFKPLAFEYDDEYVKEVEDQLLVGDSIMVTPVYEQNQSGRYVYLPEDMLLVTFESEEKYSLKEMKKGHHYIKVSLDQVPIFIRPNRMLILGQSASHTAEMDLGQITVIGYGSKQCTYKYYNDDGQGHDYDLEKNTISIEAIRKEEGISVDKHKIKSSGIKKIKGIFYETATEKTYVIDEAL